MKLAERLLRRNDYVITSPYGIRIHPITREKSMHEGTDYFTKKEKWDVYALEDGVVKIVGYDKNNGNYLWVHFPRLNIKLFMCHLDSILVTKNQIVFATTVLAKVGTTGRSTGIHLHLGVRWISTNKYFNPEVYDYQIASNGLSVDGQWGMNTTKALQRHYKTKVDGIISGQFKTNANKNIYSIRWGIGGSQLVKALQKDLGVKVDGYLGPQTIRALQAKLGVAITGIIQPIDPTTYALQKRLNEGTLWKTGTIGS